MKMLANASYNTETSYFRGRASYVSNHPEGDGSVPPDGRLQYSIASSQASENHMCEFIWLNIYRLFCACQQETAQIRLKREKC